MLFKKQGINCLNQLNAGMALTQLNKFNKISWQSENPYNKRWQFKIKNAYYTYPRDGNEHTHVKKPQDSKEVAPFMHGWIYDVIYRYIPGLQCWIDRKSRISDTFQIYVLPLSSLSFFQFWDLNFGFKVLTVVPMMLFWIRGRDRTLDPDFKETFLRDMIYKVPEITQYFNEDTIHVLDYDCEYDAGYDVVKFPEYKNKVWQFFNSDTAMTTGHFKFGDVESGATMLLKFKTMPIGGKSRYQVAEPYYFYDLRAEITHKGIFKEVVLVDEKVELKKLRPFLYLI